MLTRRTRSGRQSYRMKALPIRSQSSRHQALIIVVFQSKTVLVGTQERTRRVPQVRSENLIRPGGMEQVPAGVGTLNAIVI